MAIKSNKFQEGNSFNESQNIGFKVTVYRLNLGGPPVKIGPEGTPYDINKLLYMDSFDIGYTAVAKWFEEPLNFKNFLSNVKSQIKSGMAASPSDLMSNKGIFKQIDITPLVASVQTNLSIHGDNACSITMTDYAFTDFGESNISTADSMVPRGDNLSQLPDDAAATASESAKSKKDKAAASALATRQSMVAALRGFLIREFDLVRVDVFSSTEDSWQERAAGFSKLFPQINPSFASTTQFTGLVTSITRSASVSGTPTSVVACAGLSSVFTRGTVVFDKAIAQTITEKGSKNLRILDTEMNTYAHRFMNKNSREVFLTLMDDYFFIRDKSTKPKPDDKQALYMPIINADAWSENLTSAKDGGEILTQFLPTLSCYHILKHFNAEPLVMIDDYLPGKELFMTEPGSSGKLNFAVTKDASELLTVLKPYLDMIRTSYQLFDSSYMQPSAILDEIRNNSFFEIYEDRCGGFRFRLPRYNSCFIRHSCTSNNTISASLEKSDSALFNVSQAQNMNALIGVMAKFGLAGEVHMDQFSIFRYGLRMPQIVDNPNAIVPEMATEISRHIGEYNSALNSRKATIVRTLDPNINVGEMVTFQLCPPERVKNGVMSSGEEDMFVGYVIGITENISVSGSSSQTLTLTMVRPIGSLVDYRESVRKSVVETISAGDQISGGTIYVTARQAAGLIKKKSGTAKVDRKISLYAPGITAGKKTVSTSTYGGDPISSKVQEISARPWSYTAISNEPKDWLVPVTLSQIGGISVSFKYISDPMRLSAVAGRTQPKLQSFVDAHRAKDISTMSSAQRVAAVNSALEVVRDRGKSLAAGTVFKEVVDSTIARANTRVSASLVGDNSFKVKSLSDAVVLGYKSSLKEKMSELNRSPRSVTIQFPGAIAPQTFTVEAGHINKPLTELVEMASSIFVGEGKRSGAEWYKSEFKRLLLTRQEPALVPADIKPATYTQEDVDSATLLARHFVGVYLRAESARLGLEQAVNDSEAADRVEALNNITREAAAADAADAKNPKGKSIGNPASVTGVPHAVPGTVVSVSTTTVVGQTAKTGN